MDKDTEIRLEQALSDCKDVIKEYNLNGIGYWPSLSNKTDSDLVKFLFEEGKKLVNEFKNDIGFTRAITCYYDALVLMKREYEKGYDKIIHQINLDVNVMHQSLMP